MIQRGPADCVAGTGAIVDVAVTQPAAGAEWTVTMPALTRRRLISGRALLTTDATVISRWPRIGATAGANLALFAGTNIAVTASLACHVLYNPGAGATSNIASLTAPTALPVDCLFFAGDVVASSTVNIQAADQWSAVVLRFEEWVEA